MHQWQRIWRVGLAAQLSTAGLERLRLALIRDDSCLVQGETLFPPALAVFADEAVECACAVGYCLWKGAGLRTVAELAAAFEGVCVQADELLGEAAACRQFFDWFDRTPRAQMRFEMLQEVNRVLNERHESAA